MVGRPTLQRDQLFGIARPASQQNPYHSRPWRRGRTEPEPNTSDIDALL